MDSEYEVTNYSYSNPSKHVYESWVPAATLFLFGVGGNALALLLLFLSRNRHRWRPFYRLVFCLATTDFLGILLVFPFVMMRYASNFTYDFPENLCHYYISFIFTFAPMSSAFIICAMSIDRFLAVLYPHSYRGRCKYRRVHIMLFIQLVAALLISSLHLFGLGNAHRFYPQSWCFFNFVAKDTLNRANSYLYSVVGVVTVAVIVVLNVVVIFTLCRRVRCGICMNNHVRSDDRNNLKIIMFLIVIVFVLAGLWLPLIMNILLHAALVIEGEGKTELLVIRLSITNAIVDPWIYILLRRETLELGQQLIGKYFDGTCCARFFRQGSDRQSLTEAPRRRQPDLEKDPLADNKAETDAPVT